MGLSVRQTRAYTDTVDVYEPTLSAGANSLTDWTYPATPTYTMVKCRIQPKPEALVPMIMGRSGADQIDTTDILHVPISQEISTKAAVRLTTPGHPEYGNFWQIQGDARVQGWRAGKKSYYLKRSIKPQGVV